MRILCLLLSFLLLCSATLSAPTAARAASRAPSCAEASRAEPAGPAGALAADTSAERRSDLMPPTSGYDPNQLKRTMTLVLGTVVAAALGCVVGAGLGGAVVACVGAAIGGLAGYFFSRLAAKDLFPEPATEAYGQVSNLHTYQQNIPRPTVAGQPDPYSNGYYGGQTGADLDGLFTKYQAALTAFQDAIKSGDRAQVGASRQEYTRARSAYLRARGTWVGPAVVAP